MDRGDWWSVYGDANLSSLLREVDVSNQNIAYAQAAFRQSVAIVQQARAGLFPMLGFSYKVWDNTKLDMGYRYLHLQGTSVTGRSTSLVENLKIPDQHTHELRAGVRFDIN